MGFVIAAVIVVLLIAGFVTFFVMNATRKTGPVADTADEGAPGIGADETPLGDTQEHAGEQRADGATERDPERDGPAREGAGSTAHVARPGEGEGGERLEFEDERPRSEQLADRER